MIKAESLSFSYGKTALFKELDLSLDAGLYGLLGKNGAGKSTLLKIFSGLLFFDSGSCRIMGYDPKDRNPLFLSDLFYLAEEFYMPAVKGKEYSEIYSPFYPGFDMNRFEKSLDEFELDNNKLLTSFSYGQKKKYLIAFGLSSGAGIMFLDEPVNGLDIPSKSQFRRLTASAAAEDRCIIISTHQVRDMEGLIDPVIILENGKIIFNHSMEEVSKKLKYSFSLSRPVENDEIVHAEKIPGGWAVISRNRGDSEGAAIDLEILFNSVIQKPDYIENILNSREGVR